jgi:hypothetical protein
MTRIVVDAILREKLHDLEEPIELCDERGRVLARVFPEHDPAQLDLTPKISRDELLRRKASNEKTFSTAEVLAHLERQ